MATARELLDEADALMRRRRASEAEDIPVLTDAVDDDVVVEPDPHALDLPLLTNGLDGSAQRDAGDFLEDMEMSTDLGMSTYTSAMDSADFPHQSASPARPAETSAPAALPGQPLSARSTQFAAVADAGRVADEPETPAAQQAPAGVHGSQLTAIPKSLAASQDEEPQRKETISDKYSASTPSVGEAPFFKTNRELPPVTFGDYLIDPLLADAQPLAAGEIAEHIDIPAIEDDRGQAMLEQITMNVLQRIDILSAAALQEKLAEHLRPIVNRASADLLITINQQVGELLRSYVAEAIEREIAAWREQSRK